MFLMLRKFNTDTISFPSGKRELMGVLMAYLHTRSPHFIVGALASPLKAYFKLNL